MQAIIDLGTNTFHLLIGKITNGKFEIAHKASKPIKLGEDIAKANQIIPTAFTRGIDCLVDFKKKIDEFNISSIRAVATSAVRSASNGQEFIDCARHQAHIHITLISGDEEAQYIYQGVKASGAITQKSLIMDIGGGSTEFILCDENGINWKQSFDIGASRLMQHFFKSDPLSKADEQKTIDYLNRQLQTLANQIASFKPTTLIGSAGAFETYAELLDGTINLENPCLEIDLPAYQQISHQLLKSTHQERANMRGLIPLRVDIIVMAALQTNYVLGLHPFQRMLLSTYDLKMGLLADGDKSC